MKDYVIMTDSSCDLPAEMADGMGLKVVPLTVSIGGRDYLNELDGRELKPSDFYGMLRNGAFGETSVPSVELFSDTMESILKNGGDVLYIGFSSSLSGTYNSGRIAAEIMRERYPEQKIITVDSLCASLGQGLLLELTVKEKKNGATIEEAAKFAENTKLSICHWFTVADLKFLHRGGRIDAVTAAVGTMLNIKPVMHMDDQGKLVPVYKVRGSKALLSKLCGLVRETGVDYERQTVYISHGDSPEDAQALAEALRGELGISSFIINEVGPVIGAHSGPGTLALFFVGKTR